MLQKDNVQKWEALPVPLYIIVVIIFIGLFVTLLVRFWDGLKAETLVMSDYQGYYAAAVLINNGQNPYDYDLALQHIDCFNANCQYRYPAFFAALLVPTTTSSLLFGQRFWIVCNVLFLLLTIYFSIRILPQPLPKWFWLLAAAGILSFYPIWVNYQLGNISMLLGFLVTLAYWFWQRDRRVLAGICIGISIVVKYYPGILIPYFLWKKEYRLVVYSVLTTLILMVLPDILFQQNLLQEHVSSLVSTVNMEGFTSDSFIDNQSLHSFFARLYVLFTGTDMVPGFVRIPSLAISGILGLLVVFLSPRDRRPASPLTIIEYGLILFLFAISAFNSWSHYYAWLVMIIPALLYLLWKYAAHYPGWKPYSLIALAIAGLVMTSQPYRLPRLLGYNVQVETLTLSAFGVLLQSLLVYGILIIAIIGLILLNAGKNKQLSFVD